MTDRYGPYKFEWLRQLGFDVSDIECSFLPGGEDEERPPFLVAKFKLNGNPLKITKRSTLGVWNRESWLETDGDFDATVDRMCRDAIYQYVNKLLKEKQKQTT